MHPIKHFLTITKHRHKVIVHCFKAGIPVQGLMHDMSKYSPTEFIQGAKYYQGSRSPNEAERESRGYSLAWMHHKGRNRHHFEYWTDYNPKTKQLEPVEMPIRYVKEMFCDRVAASKIYKGSEYRDSDPYEYFLKGRDKRRIHPNTAALLEKLLIMLKDEGEKKTFKYIKSLKDNNKPPTKGGSFLDTHRPFIFTVLLTLLIIASAAVGIVSAVMRINLHSEQTENTASVDTPDTADSVLTSDIPDITITETADMPEEPAEPAEPETPDYVVHYYETPPEKYNIKVKHITQQDKLITGCELISTKTVLEYYGKKNISLDTMIDNMEQSRIFVSDEGLLYALSPSQAFIGDPHQTSGFGCFPPVIENMVESLGCGDLIAEDTTGMSLGELCATYVIQDIPPLIWVTDSMIASAPGDSWRLWERKAR